MFHGCGNGVSLSAEVDELLGALFWYSGAWGLGGWFYCFGGFGCVYMYMYVCVYTYMNEGGVVWRNGNRESGIRNAKKLVLLDLLYFVCWIEGGAWGKRRNGSLESRRGYGACYWDVYRWIGEVCWSGVGICVDRIAGLWA